MISSYQAFIKSRLKLILMVSLGLSIMGTASFYTSSEINMNPVAFILLWFLVLFALSGLFLLTVHSVLYFLFRRK